MCGIFGIVGEGWSRADIQLLASRSERRGKDSSGLVVVRDNFYAVERADWPLRKLLATVRLREVKAVMGHSRLVTNGLADNQPVVRDGIIVLHNGIVVNHSSVWASLEKKRRQEIDTEVIAAIVASELEAGRTLEHAAVTVLERCEGTIACAVAVPSIGKLALFSNNGSLYAAERGDSVYFASERYTLRLAHCRSIREVRAPWIVALPRSTKIEVRDHKTQRANLIPSIQVQSQEEKLLVYPQPVLRRCTKCILPETMPFITFDEDGVCNYCRSYEPTKHPRGKEALLALVEPYRRKGEADCIVPLSGGRDSSYALHLIVNELGMKPITFTYDWGMVTDLARRNISRMCSALGVENIIVADDIQRKRRYIAANLRAWLRAPHLGMVSILTAGDKHFFRHVETIKRETGIELNLWGTCPLEVTHFKAGFLGISPDPGDRAVYARGIGRQLRYQAARFRAMLQSPGYFNESMWDNLLGEYYRSVHKKTGYVHVYDYWDWEERRIEQVLAMYEWETAPDTNSTWRIGDGTAAFYNYIYHTVAGFTEHDTFRSNQIREGQMTREEALLRVKEENRPRFPNIKWYLDALGFDFAEVINAINRIPRLYSE